MSVKKWFSLEEANAMLPFVDQELKKMQALKRQFEDKYVELRDLKNEHAEKPSQEKDPFFVMEAALEFIQIEARGLIHNFQTTGIELKDIETGLVDFPAMLEGHEVLLCWKQGEDRIRYYHSKEDGFAGRKPISE
ncbi:DUF2203 domain-containing protein [Paenibacillus alba]|uniref:DUF2203 domain-containing protein n=1 Tax=Paenibacillus alba TaxID=1197127 RepID=A0ABU6FVB3_9BACL|nr:DUF2203 domain-containing protein [Paenibacillus alba]MEC0225828.1 DUF2203 domain-containing protein [Paenibacillus alba]NQX70679.1 DUF2203 domain-containing protein [Paenibacillus alba]